MTFSSIVSTIVNIFDKNAALRTMCPDGTHFGSAAPNSVAGETGYSGFEKLDGTHEHNTGTDHPEEIVFQMSGWFANDTLCFQFVELIKLAYASDQFLGGTILITGEDVIEESDQIWQGVVEITLTVETGG